MNPVAAAVAGLAAVAGTAIPPTPAPGGPIELAPKMAATVGATPAKAGARPIQLTLTLHTELQCGRPRAAAAVVVFPAAFHLPRTISRMAVQIDGAAAASVTVAGRTVAIGLARHAGLTCDILAPGTVRVMFSPAAGLGNPAAPGHYRIAVRLGGAVGTAVLDVA